MGPEMTLEEYANDINARAPRSWHMGSDRTGTARTPLFFCWVEEYGFTTGETLLEAAERMALRLREQQGA